MPIPLPYKILASLFWLALCCLTFQGDGGRSLFLSLVFLFAIWIKRDSPLTNANPRTVVIIFSILGLVLTGLTIGFQNSNHRLLSAVLIAFLFATLAVGWSKTPRSTDPLDDKNPRQSE